ncbi:hypothetical protein SAMN04487993_101366 [Salipiger marinus]|uniref:Uncharacterized protein n=1 Tax=Salipiger marinus TaxID=555512 RepID=A0A1G8PR72_9RHOB|nr:hypothetical protein SAMN04487993_101366 [Salipiger marinus]
MPRPPQVEPVRKAS